MGLMDGSGTRVVEYTYDAWGKLISTSGTLASTLGADNPFRYRGYYYDAETGLYYLMTRYYDPEVGRFLSADVYLSTGQGVLGNNRFAYCNNDPILFYDSDGTSPITPILNLIDFSAIHKMVQISILKELGGTAKMEVYVKTDNGRIGFLDIYDLSNNWYYEVKSKGLLRKDRWLVMRAQKLYLQGKDLNQDKQSFLGAFHMGYGM